MTVVEVLDRLPEQLRRTLGAGDVKVEVEPLLGRQGGRALKADALVLATVRKRRLRFLVEVRTHVTTANVRFALDRLKTCRGLRPDALPLLAAPYLSRAMRELCRESRIGCLDLSGNALIEALDVDPDEDRANRLAQEIEGRRSPFADLSSLVLRQLRTLDPTEGRVGALARGVGQSPGFVSKVCSLLVAQGYARWKKRGCIAVDGWEKIFDGWLRYQRDHLNTLEAHATPRRPEDLAAELRRLLGGRHGYSATGRAALALLGREPWPRVWHLHVEDGSVPERLAQPLALKAEKGTPGREWREGGHDAGTQICFIFPSCRRSFAFHSELIQGVRVVSPLQFFLDWSGSRLDAEARRAREHATWRTGPTPAAPGLAGLVAEDFTPKAVEDVELDLLHYLWTRPGDAALALGALQPGHFSKSSHRSLFAAVAAAFGTAKGLREDPYVVVRDELRRRGELDRVGGPPFLWRVLGRTPAFPSLQAALQARLRSEEAPS